MDLGVARGLDPLSATPEDVRAVVLAMLEDHRFRQAAERFRAENAALPEPEYAVTLLERLLE